MSEKNMDDGSQVGFLFRIQAEYAGMSQNERQICDFIRNHGRDIIHMTIGEMAEKCDTSEASVVRLSKKLGYKGFQALKINIAQNIIEPESQIHPSLTRSSDIASVASRVFSASVQTLEDTLKILDLGQVEKAVDMIGRARRLLFYGVGGSGPLAADAQHKFLKIGCLAQAFSDANLQAMASSILGPNDVLVAISHSGASTAIVESVQMARESGAGTICITNYGRSPLQKYCDVHLHTSSVETAFKSDALASRIAELAIIDLLFIAVTYRRYDKAYGNLQKTRRSLDGLKL